MDELRAEWAGQLLTIYQKINIILRMPPHNEKDNLIEFPSYKRRDGLSLTIYRHIMPKFMNLNSLRFILEINYIDVCYGLYQ